MISQNGWPVIDAGQLAPVIVRGVGMAPGVRHNLAPLFQDLVEHLAELEPPHEGWCWGWAVRPVRGQTSGYSNHASGSAIDYNAPKHPRQAKDRYAGWATSQVRTIHHLLATRYQGVIRWGADYRPPSTPDPMHFEVAAGPDAVARLLHHLQEVDDVTKQELVEALRAAFSPGYDTVNEWAAQLNQVRRDQAALIERLEQAGVIAADPK